MKTFTLLLRNSLVACCCFFSVALMAQSDCCTPGGNGSPGCDDADCEATICAIDPFCCDNTWDGICAGEAADLCGSLCTGECPKVTVCHRPPGKPDNCKEISICEDDVEDHLAHGDILGECPALCGIASEGDCCEANGSIGCNDVDCQSAVCAIDPFCCETEWDGLCASQAEISCPDCAPPAGDGDCCSANGTPGCDDADCQATVCASDPFCCDTEWDGLCADEAVGLCGICTTGSGDCCSANGTPGCDDAGCQATVCAFDPFCCDTEWDGICAGEAADFCGICPPVIAQQTGGAKPQADITADSEGYVLWQNKPNPVVKGHETTITFELPKESDVTVELFDASGRLIMTPVQQTLPAGQHQSIISTGSMADGIYYYRLITDDVLQAAKRLIVVAQ